MPEALVGDQEEKWGWGRGFWLAGALTAETALGNSAGHKGFLSKVALGSVEVCTGEEGPQRAEDGGRRRMLCAMQQRE